MKSKYILIFASLAVLLATFGVVAEEAKKTEKTDAVAETAAKGEKDKGKEKNEKTNTPVALTMEAIQELDDRKKALDEREQQLAEKARALEVQEKILNEKLRKMEELNKKMAERLDTFKKETEDKVTKLVTMVETMRPQAAAEYLENLEPELAVQILARIQVVKAAKIMNLVDKKKGARLSELYTGYMQNTTMAPSAPTATAPATGNVNKEANDAKKM